MDSSYLNGVIHTALEQQRWKVSVELLASQLLSLIELGVLMSRWGQSF